VLASWLHRRGPRRDEVFVDLNCAGLSRELLETELFGHEKGAFTGAIAAKTGLFESADGGTLFLDEIGDVDLQVQPKLLKVLEEGRFRRLGEVRDRTARVWLIAATHQDLADLVAQKRFREDLFYRISTIPLRLPSLRERPEDIPALAGQFLVRVSTDLGRRPPALSPAALRRLQAHSWPGNIRELRNVMERAALLASGRDLIGADLLPDAVVRSGRAAGLDAVGDLSLEALEREHIAKVLGICGHSRSQAARLLGIHRSTLLQKIARYGFVRPS
jgi:transcriptional regulator with PAS, ATPase and Fis domain